MRYVPLVDIGTVFPRLNELRGCWVRATLPKCSPDEGISVHNFKYS